MSRTLRILFASLLLVSGAARLAQGAPVGDPQAGQGKSVVCGACHGPDGNSVVPIFPKLAGQGERYLLKQLRDIRDGKRQVPEMGGLLTGIGDQDLADMSAWYASQKGSATAASPALAVHGEALFRGGKLDEGVPACLACHGPEGAGLAAAGFPQLRGQQAEYLNKQLTAYREGKRTNDGEAAIMRSISARLSDQDIEALAAYIQSLP